MISASKFVANYPNFLLHSTLNIFYSFDDNEFSEDDAIANAGGMTMIL